MPIQYTDATQNDAAGQLHPGNNTITVRTNVPGTKSSAAATGFPLKLEQVQNVNTKKGLPDNTVLVYNKADGMWHPSVYSATSAQSNTVIKRFEFVDSLEWEVKHNLNTTVFTETLVNSDGSKFVAKTKILNPNSFVVFLTAAESGYVDVVFTLN